jgi:hypothetical protein
MAHITDLLIENELISELSRIFRKENRQLTLEEYYIKLMAQKLYDLIKLFPRSAKFVKIRKPRGGAEHKFHKVD